MKRIAIIGSGCTGKSTLARQLGSLLHRDREVIHLDRLFWKPGWVQTPKAEWRAQVEALVQSDSWIMDGHYGGTQDVRLAAADTIIFLDFSRLICVWRVFKRWLGVYRGEPRPDMAPGCVERLDWEFLKWIWAFNDRSRPHVLERLSRYGAGKRVIILRNPAAVRRFLAEARPG